jgi:NAD+ synthase (glutamine-hydrolysing)
MSNKLKRKHKKHKQAKQPEDVRLGQPNRRLEKKRFEEILKIQSLALANRFKKTNIPKAILGISGGVDSTWALIVTCEAFKYLKRPLTDIIGVTMPGLATTSHTKINAHELMEALSVTAKEIDITEACKTHFKAINQPPNQYDTTYENVQARERTMVLMNLSNQMNGLVVGTGNLSELALGWCTFDAPRGKPTWILNSSNSAY